MADPSPSSGEICPTNSKEVLHTQEIDKAISSVSAALQEISRRVQSTCDKPPQYGSKNLRFVKQSDTDDRNKVNFGDTVALTRAANNPEWQYYILRNGTPQARLAALQKAVVRPKPITDYNSPGSPTNTMRRVLLEEPPHSASTPYAPLPIIPKDQKYWEKDMVTRTTASMEAKEKSTGSSALCSAYIAQLLLQTTGELVSEDAWGIEQYLIKKGFAEKSPAYLNPASERASLSQVFKEYRTPVDNKKDSPQTTERKEFFDAATNGEHPKLLGVHFAHTKAEPLIMESANEKGRENIIPHSHVIMTIPTTELLYTAEKGQKTVGSILERKYKTVDWADPLLEEVTVSVGSESPISLKDALKRTLKPGESFTVHGTCITDYYGGNIRVLNLALMMAERSGKSPLYAPVSVTSIDPLLKRAHEGIPPSEINEQNTRIALMTANTDKKTGKTTFSIQNEKGAMENIPGSIGEYMVKEALGREMTNSLEDRKCFFELLEVASYFFQVNPNNIPDGTSFFPVLTGIGEQDIHNLHTKYKEARKAKKDIEISLPQGTPLLQFAESLVAKAIPNGKDAIPHDAFNRFFKSVENTVLFPAMDVIKAQNPFSPFAEESKDNTDPWERQFQWEQTLFLSPSAKDGISSSLKPAWEAFQKAYQPFREGYIEPKGNFPFTKAQVLESAEGDPLVAHALIAAHYVENGGDIDFTPDAFTDPNGRRIEKSVAESVGYTINSYGLLQVGKNITFDNMPAILAYAERNPSFGNSPLFVAIKTAYEAWEKDQTAEKKKQAVMDAIVQGLSGQETLGVNTLVKAQLKTLQKAYSTWKSNPTAPTWDRVKESLVAISSGNTFAFPILNIPTEVAKTFLNNLFKEKPENDALNIGIAAVIFEEHRTSAEVTARMFGLDPVKNPETVLRIMLDLYQGVPTTVREAWGVNALMATALKLGMPQQELDSIKSQIQAKRTELSSPDKPFPEAEVAKESFIILIKAIIDYLKGEKNNLQNPHILALKTAFPEFSDIDDLFKALEKERDAGTIGKLNMYGKKEKLGDQSKGKEFEPLSPKYVEFARTLQASTGSSLADIYTFPEGWEYLSRYSRRAERSIADSPENKGKTPPFGSVRVLPQELEQATIANSISLPSVQGNIPDFSNPQLYKNNAVFYEQLGLGHGQSLLERVQATAQKNSNDPSLPVLEDRETANIFQKYILLRGVSQEKLFFSMEAHIAVGKRFFMEWREGGKYRETAGIFIEDPSGQLSVIHSGKPPKKEPFSSFLGTIYTRAKKGDSPYLRVTIATPENPPNNTPA